MKYVNEMLAAFRAFKGAAVAIDAISGSEHRVTNIENLASHDGYVHFEVVCEDERRFSFQASTDHDSNGSFVVILISKPDVPSTEVEVIKIFDGGVNDYPEFGGCKEPKLAVTIVNQGAKERNEHPIAQAKRRAEEKNTRETEAFHAAQKRHYESFRQRAVIPLLEVLKGRQVKDLEMEAGVLTIHLEDAPPVRVQVTSVGVRLGDSIVNCPEITVLCGEHKLSGTASIFKPFGK
ncbi:MAG: hypothetical protein RDU25_01775 [Patescibacteria group bacterium]|nr:hypothetical protein [Patescibacteria group bacterium]